MNAEPMKVMTLHQPYATLVALGVKTIETRSQRTNVRGRIAIHAAKRHTDDGMLGDFVIRNGVIHDCGSLCSPLPLGAIVATAELYDCIPMVRCHEEGAIRTLDLDDNGSLWIVEPQTDEEAEEVGADCREVTDEKPYGHFTPGRWAWMLADIRPLANPVPFLGGQGWSRSWTPVPAGGVG